MKLIQCEKGHYYDRERFEFCPYCNADRENNITVPLRSGIESDLETKGVPQPEQITAAQQWQTPQEPESTWKMPENDNSTVSYYSRMLGKDPVVGWLVAVEGAYYGEAFPLKTGRNFIGRSPEMDIQLSMDRSVSRRKHAIVIYEPKAKIYIAQPGESNELFYLNDEVVLNHVTLEAYDVLSVGETKFLFVPLCGEKFSWEEWKKVD